MNPADRSDPGNIYGKRDRYGRVRGPWKKPGRHPCDYTAANGVRCDLESLRAWERTRLGVLTHYAPGWRPSSAADLVRLGFRYFDRCALHPPDADKRRGGTWNCRRDRRT